MRSRLLVLTIAAGLLVVPAPIAYAHGGDHGSCKAFGVDHVSLDAKILQPSGRLVSEFARAGFINDHVAADHFVLCEPRPS